MICFAIKNALNAWQIAAFLSTCQPKFAANPDHMQIVVNAGEAGKKAWQAKLLPQAVVVHWLEEGAAIPAAEAYFDLCFEENDRPAFGNIVEAPVFLNAVVRTTNDLPKNHVRINAWPGFLENEKIEIAANNDTALAAAIAVLDQLQWKYQRVPDVTGMIAPRVIAMIVNEAYFALGEEISTKSEIDTAMKLGTNYPFGPFEWSEKIGLKKIFALLQQLAAEDKRYTIAPLLEKEARQSINQ
jgi:3-hydroxybutyryl-CoA dehydrogenase